MFKHHLPRRPGLALCLLLFWALVLPAQPVVMDQGTTHTFYASEAATNFAWTLDGVAVGGNSNRFDYQPQIYDVGTHYLMVNETLPGAVNSNSCWAVRVRIALLPSGANYYVATNGSDDNAGTLDAPFETLEKARNAVRNLARPLPANGVTIWLRGGTYLRTNTLMLTDVKDFGTATAPIVYRSYTNETAVISGGKPIAAARWVPLNSSQTNRVAPGVNPTNIWELDATNIIHVTNFPAEFNQWTTFNVYNQTTDGGMCELIYNGQRQFVSRYPNHSLVNDDLLTTNMAMDGVAKGLVNANVTLSYATDSTNSLNYPGTYTNSSGQAVAVGGAFYCKTNDIARFTRWQTALTNGGLWLQGYWRVPWQIDGIKIIGFDVTNRAVWLATNAHPGNGIGYKYTRPAGSKAEPFWAVNLLEEMDQPGEWCVDFNRKKIYFYAPGPIADGSVVISDFGAPLVQITGGSNIVFQSISFEAGLAQGILITNGIRNLVIGCNFRNLGNMAVDLCGGGTNGVVSCNLQDLAGGGVLMRGGTESINAALRVPTRNFVVNNVITNFSRAVRVYAAAVDAGFFGPISGGGGGHYACVGTRVAHNDISVSPHSAVLHASWDNVFEYNEIANFQQFSDDLGAFYSYDYTYQHGNQTFRYNFIHDSPYGNGIDFDQDGLQMHIYGNVMNLNTVARESQGYGVVYHEYNQDIPGREQPADCNNNLIANTHIGVKFVSPVPATIERNAAIFCTTNDYTWRQVIVGPTTNTIVNSSQAAMQSGPNTNYLVDPGFLSLTNNDMRLNPGSRIYADMPEFQQIPVELMGLYNDEFRTNAAGWSPFIVTTNATAVTASNAAVAGWLYFPQFESNTTVIAYYGTADGGSNALAWQKSTNAGIFASGPVGETLGPLTDSTTYYFRFFATNAFGSMWSPATYSLSTPPAAGLPVPAITNVTPSQTAWQNSTLALTGRVVYLAGPIYPSPGDPVSVTIGGVTQNGVIADGAGNFSIAFSTAGIPPSGSPYPITYLFPGSANLSAATNAATTVTLNPLLQPVFTVASAAVVSGRIAPLTGQIAAPGPVYPASGETVGVTINGSTQYGTVTNSSGNFLVNFDSTGFAISTTSYPVTYFYPGSANLDTATNTVTTLAVCPPDFFWTGAAGTNFETGGLGGNWNNYAAPVSDLVSATAIFSNAPAVNQPSLTASRSLSGLLFATPGGGWTLGCGSANYYLSIGGGGVSTTGQTGGTNVIRANLNVAAHQTWQAGAGGNLLLAGSITNTFGPATNYSITFNGGGSAGTVILSPAPGNRIHLAGTNGAPLLQMSGGGTLELGGDGVAAPLTDSTNILVNGSTGQGTLAIVGGASKLQVNSGVWNLGDLNGNATAGGLAQSATLEVNGGGLIFAGMRYLGACVINVRNDGVLRSANTNYLVVNDSFFALGYYAGMSPAVMNLTDNGLVDLATAGSVGATCNGIGFGSSTLLNQSGGVLQNGVTPGANAVSMFQIGGLPYAKGTTNNLSAFTLTGGTFISAGAVQGSTNAGPGSVNNFNFMGGVLAVSSFNATNLGSSPAATAYANQTNVSLAIGTLANYGGTLAPGNLRAPGRTLIAGNYAVSNTAAVLAIDIGGTSQANAFKNGGTNYDFVAITGSATLGGGLNVRFINGFVPAATNSFVILTNGGMLSGAFTNVTGGRLAVTNVAGGSFLVVTSATRVALTNFQVLFASFTASTTNGISPLTVTFTNTSTGAITNHSWNFGDGTTTNTAAANVTHTFTSAGTSLVSLVVSDPLASSTNTLDIVVTGPPAPLTIGSISVAGTDFIITGTNGTAGTDCYMLATTNLVLPMTSWTILSTNQFGSDGSVNFTNPLSPGAPQWFYRLRLP
jgi:PKD repeat protein